MPIYEYNCSNDHQIELLRPFNDDSIVNCTICRGRMQRIMSSAGLVFKGTGFYTTDYKGK